MTIEIFLDFGLSGLSGVDFRFSNLFLNWHKVNKQKENITFLWVSQYYGVPSNKVKVDLGYSVSGELDMTFPPGTKVNDAKKSVVDSITQTLGVHPKVFF